MAPQRLSEMKPCQGPLRPTTTLKIWDNKWWVGRSWEMGFQGETLGALLLLTGEKGFFQAAQRRGDHAHGINSREGCFWLYSMGIRKLPWPEPPGIFQCEREGVINRKIPSSLQILCSSEVPVTDTMWDFVREMVILWWEKNWRVI